MWRQAETRVWPLHRSLRRVSAGGLTQHACGKYAIHSPTTTPTATILAPRWSSSSLPAALFLSPSSSLRLRKAATPIR